jgi:phosphatidylethanolamine-binding protein (PEBP) family uncharacterized protein
MRNTLLGILAGMLLIATTATTSFAEEFTIDFEWGDIPLCTSGYPDTVPNPKFVLSGVPDETKIISLRMTDLDVTSYGNGGGSGSIEYSGQDVIEPGAFKYQRPCPPGATHTYEWKAYAYNKKGFLAKKLGTAKAKKDYPK